LLLLALEEEELKDVVVEIVMDQVGSCLILAGVWE
jgi:hypothetical protein